MPTEIEVNVSEVLDPGKAKPGDYFLVQYSDKSTEVVQLIYRTADGGYRFRNLKDIYVYAVQPTVRQLFTSLEKDVTVSPIKKMTITVEI